MSFVGGGTDLPEFYESHGGGAVVSTAIDKYVQVIVSPRFERDFRIGYSRTEIRERVDDIQHDLVREALRRTGLSRGLDVLTLADVPGGGTGMGSSSAVTPSPGPRTVSSTPATRRSPTRRRAWCSWAGWRATST